MRGSLAIWCETEDPEVEGRTPRVEMHFNIWCDLKGKVKNVLDIGLLIKEFRPIKTLNIYIPDYILQANMEDLFDVINDDNTIAGIFNDVLNIKNKIKDQFDVFRGTALVFRVLHLDCNNDYIIEHINEDGALLGTIISLQPAFFERMKSPCDHYIRFRINLTDSLCNLFLSATIATDSIFVSSFYRTELIEFRINEKRNFSETLKKRFNDTRPSIIDAIHYFLIRNIAVEFIQAHAAFRKVRRLEPKLWNRYLSHSDNVKPEDMLIYHWRARSDSGDKVDDFIALAMFRKSRRNLLKYILFVIGFGAIGSAIEALVTELVVRNPQLPTVLEQIAVIPVLFLLLALMYGVRHLYVVCVAPLLRCLSRICSWTLHVLRRCRESN